jgi:hypothetical protein
MKMNEEDETRSVAAMAENQRKKSTGWRKRSGMGGFALALRICAARNNEDVENKRRGETK